MNKNQNLEVWLRGQLPDILPLVQPVAHALLQAQEEIHLMLEDFPENKLWEKPAGVASVGFHLQHLSGVLDRLFAYSRKEQLSEEQLFSLHLENVSPQSLRLDDFVKRFDIQIEKSLIFLSKIDERTLTDTREVGRAKVPSTQIGLLVHAAEHTMRHVGQLSVTVRILKFYK